MARTHQEGLGSRSAAMPEVPERDEDRFVDQRARRDRAHPAPPEGLWEQGVRVLPTAPPEASAEWVIEPCYDDPFPGLRYRTDHDVRERLIPRDRCGAPPDEAEIGMFPAVLPSLGRFARRLNAIEACLTSDLTPPARSCYISTMKALIQTGSSGGRGVRAV